MLKQAHYRPYVFWLLAASIGMSNIAARFDIADARSTVQPFKTWQSAPLPILRPQGNGFEALGVYNPAVIVRGGRTIMLYRAEDHERTSRIGYASSADGRVFRRREQYVFGPSKNSYDSTSTEDPRVVQIGDTYYLTYTGYDKRHDLAQLCLATSRDLQTWRRWGVMLPARSTVRWDSGWTKSGAILPAKVNGKYWMYYLGERLPQHENGHGERDSQNVAPLREMGVAFSKDLIHWSAATKRPVLATRPGQFDSRVVEPGPPPVMTSAGVLLVYNGASESRPNGPYVYATGWALFDRNDPTKLLSRSDRPVLTVSRPWERYGTVNDVVFVEGLVRNRHRWTFYYGGADKVIGIATTEDVLQ